MAKEHTGTRLEPNEMVRVAEFARLQSKPGFELTFSKALRVLILRGLDAEEIDGGIAKKKGGGK